MINKTISKYDLYDFWSKGIPYLIKGRKYKIGKMSYGKYFVEPFNHKSSENSPFHKYTRWFEKIDNTDNYKLT